MPFSPLDYRYGSEEFKSIWTEEGRHKRQLDVEKALIWAHMKLGKVSEKDYEEIEKIAKPEIVTSQRVKEIEAETKHDIMALTKAMAEKAGASGWCIHLGATSNDIVDTAVALQIKDSIMMLRKRLCDLILVSADLAHKHRDTVMLGRTHGQAAVPITFGLKVAVWTDELVRQLNRIDESKNRICVGKFLGAVGTGAAQGEHARELQELILTHLELGVPLEYESDIYQAGLDKIAAACKKHNVVPGMYFIPPTMDPNFFVEKGFKFFTMPWAPWALQGVETALAEINRD